MCVFQRMTDKCFKKCIGKPGSSLDNSEQVHTVVPSPLLCVDLSFKAADVRGNTGRTYVYNNYFNYAVLEQVYRCKPLF